MNMTAQEAPGAYGRLPIVPQAPTDGKRQGSTGPSFRGLSVGCRRGTLCTMNVEFHYYAIYALAREAGFTDDFAFRMACSSQYVDAATSPLSFDAPRGRTEMIVTQNYVFWDDSTRNDVYLPFHFLPGNARAAASLRSDSTRNPYAVTPNGEIAKRLLTEAFRDKDPYLMGIAAHAFCDTWAHQNFSGLMESWNDLGTGSAAGSLPPAGHLHALAAPDEPDRRWMDSRLKPEARSIVNRDRYREAARKIFRYFRVFLARPFDDDELVVDRLSEIWLEPSREGRLAEYTIRYDATPWDAALWRRSAGAPIDGSALSGIRHYDKYAWAKSELARALRGGEAKIIPVGSELYASDLYRWNEAAIEHRRRAQAAIAAEGL
ncbi:MAG: hypothetical protein E4H20_03400 [Spirochaetales bacterium]|nr:MAG: hypothetical protein E4H20_03400 [Spirochaetales bacterium]